MEVKWSRPNSRLYPTIGVKGLRNTATNLGHTVEISASKKRHTKHSIAVLDGIQYSEC
jgi:hypothetical protein